MKGAPERVLSLCERTAQASRPLASNAFMQRVAALGGDGLRVLEFSLGSSAAGAESLRGGAPRGLELAGRLGVLAPLARTRASPSGPAIGQAST